VTTTNVRRAAVVVGAALWASWVCAHAFSVPGALIGPLVDHPLDGFPHLSEALWRAGRGVAGAALVLLAAWQLGRVLLRRVPFESRADAMLFTLAIGVVGLGSSLLLLTAVGAYRPVVVVAVVLGFAVMRPSGVRRDWTALVRRARAVLQRHASAAGDRVFVAIAVAALGYSALVALAPETEYDALWYHLWLPREWLANGHLTDPAGEYIGLYPGGWELLNGAAMVMGGPVAARVLHFACLPLGGLAACVVARWCAPGTSAPMVFALAITPPTVMWEASTAYVDLALGWFATLVIVAIVRHAASGERHWLWLGAVVMGGALGIKHLALVVLAIAGATLLILEAKRKGPVAAVGTAALFGLAALALALPWYGRAYAASGNPVFPELYGLFGALPDTRWSPDTQDALQRFADRFGRGRSPLAQLMLPWNLAVHAASFAGTFGPLFLILAPFGFAGSDARRRGVLLAAVGAYLLVWASPRGSFQLRFLVPLVPSLAVLAAAGASRVAGAAAPHGPVGRWSVAGTVALLLALNLPPFIEWHERDRRGWNGWLTHVHRSLPLAVVLGAESEHAYLSRTVPTYSAWQRISELTPPESVVLTFLSGDHLYGTRRRLWSDATLATDVTWGALAGDEPRMLAAAARHDVTHVLFARDQLDDEEFQHLAIASTRTRDCCLELLYEDPHVLLYRLEWPVDVGGSAPASR